MARSTPGNYVPLDVNYPSDAAIRMAGEAAELLFVRGLAYCKRTKTDGFIPEYDLPVVAVGLRSVPKRVAALVAHGLWTKESGGWRVRSWPKWNRPAAREAEFVEGQSKAGTKGNHERWHVGRNVTDSDCEWCNPNRGPDRVADPEPESHPRIATKGREGKGSTEAKASGRKRPPADPKPDDSTPDDAGVLVAWWIDRQTRRPPNTVVGQVAKHVGALLAEDFTPDQIRAGLTELLRKRLNPSTLPSLVNDVANRPLTAVPNGGRPEWDF